MPETIIIEAELDLGWLLTPQTMALNILGIRKTLPGLKSFYRAGQWVEPGGTLSLAAVSARNVIQMICRAAGRSFGVP